jgi:hypothetical protein
VTVSDLASITNADGAKWNSLSIDQSKANNDTNLSLSGLEDGTYSLYAVDAAGNLSQAAADRYTVSPAADTTAPTATLTTGSGRSATGIATVQSSETGTAYLVKTGGTGAVTVSTLTSITGADGAKWNSVPIDTASAATSLGLTGLEEGTYQLYTVDAAGNLSAPSSNSFTVDNTAPKLQSMQIESATRDVGGNSKVIDVGDTITFSLTMSENIEVLNGSNAFTLGFAVDPSPGAAAVNRKATYDRFQDNKIYFTYTVASNDFDVNGVSINATSTGSNFGLVLGGGVSIKDVVGNTSNSTTNSGGDFFSAAIGANSAYRINAISLGTGKGNLIFGTQAEGNWYYWWDKNGNGVSDLTVNTRPLNADNTTFNDANALNATTVADGDYSFNLSLPSLGVNPLPATTNTSFPNTNVASGTANNPTYDGLAAVWDAVNGTSGTSGIPYGWLSSVSGSGLNPNVARVWTSDAYAPVSGVHYGIGFATGVATLIEDSGIYTTTNINDNSYEKTGAVFQVL